MSDARPWTAGRDGITLHVRLTPGAAKDRIGGTRVDADGRCWLLAQVRTVPEKGRADEALERLLAKALGLSRTAVTLRAGSTARTKTLQVAGDPVTLIERLELWVDRA